MGNCQAAEAATVVIQHPPGNNNTKRVDMIYWPISAHEVMNSNPGHYLLKPDDTLLIGQVYRLISFEGAISNFVSILLCSK
ncbi:hypothetical protein LINPERPRIM_LOCUS39644 [Linum perenne]